MISKQSLAFALALSITAGTASAEMSVAVFKQGSRFRENSPERLQYDAFLNGVAEGISYSDTMAGKTGKRLYCTPGRFVLDGAAVAQLVRQELNQAGAMNNTKLDQYAISLLAIHGLQTTYPCK